MRQPTDTHKLLSRTPLAIRRILVQRIVAARQGFQHRVRRLDMFKRHQEPHATERRRQMTKTASARNISVVASRESCITDPFLAVGSVVAAISVRVAAPRDRAV